MRIADLKGELARVDVEGTIISKSAVRSVNLRAGGSSTVADAVVKDDSGSIKVSLWGSQIDLVKVGDRVKIFNGYTKAFRGEISLNIGRYGQLVKS